MTRKTLHTANHQIINFQGVCWFVGKHDKLVGGFNPSEKYPSNWSISPTRGKNEQMFEIVFLRRKNGGRVTMEQLLSWINIKLVVFDTALSCIAIYI